MSRRLHQYCYAVVIATGLLFSLIVFPIVVIAAWVDADKGLWHSVSTDPWAQMHTALVERVKVIGSGIRPPELAGFWTCYAGRTNEVVSFTSVWAGVTNVFPVTNSILKYVTIGTTNVFEPFEYTYDGGSSTGVCVPHVTYYWMDEIDRVIDELIPHFVSAGVATGDNLNAYFALTNDAGEYPSVFPAYTKASLFNELGIGYARDLVTNDWGWITGGSAWFTRQPLTTRNTPLAESVFTTAGWAFNDIQTFSRRFYDTTAFPILRYTTGGSNPVPGMNVTIVGDQLDIPDQTTTPTSEVVAISSSNTPLTIPWYSIASITCGVDGSNIGDIAAIVWTNEIVLYGDYSLLLYKEDIIERQRAIGALVWSEVPNIAWTQDGTSHAFEGEGFDQTSWPSAKAQAIADWGGGPYEPAPLMETRGAYEELGAPNNSTGYRAHAFCVAYKIQATDITPYVPYDIQLYTWAEAPWYASDTNRSGPTVFDDNGFPLFEDHYGVSVMDVDQTNATYLTDWIGTYSGIPNWCSAPPPIGPISSTNQGFRLVGLQGLLQWNFNYPGP
jgi:hypothetical protein